MIKKNHSVIAIVNINPKYPGGLLQATYERLIRLDEYYNLKIININHYGGTFYNILKKIFHYNKVRNAPRGNEYYQKIQFENLDYKYGIIDVFFHFFAYKLLLKKINKFFIKKYKNLKKFDYIYNHWGLPNSYFANNLSLILKIPYVNFFHGSDIYNLNSQKKNLLIKSMNNANINFFMSFNLYNEAKKLGYSKSNYEITRNGIDYKNINTYKKSYSVGFIGSLDLKKGADRLPLIFKYLNLDSNIKFYVVGTGELKNHLVKRFKELNVSVNMINKIEHKYIYKLYQHLNCVVIPSRFESFGIVSIEASANNCWVIASKVGGLAENLKPNLLVDTTENKNFEEKFAKRVKTFLNKEFSIDDQLKKPLNEFFWDNILEKEIKSINKVINL